MMLLLLVCSWYNYKTVFMLRLGCNELHALHLDDPCDCCCSWLILCGVLLILFYFIYFYLLCV